MSTFQNQDIVEMTRGASLLRLAPQAGGRLLSWQVGGTPVVLWPDDANWARPAGVRGGNPLLFPFIGRHRVDGELGRWRDAQGTVHELPSHGFARDLPFSAEQEADGHGLRMTLTDSEATRAGYPFGFRFEAVYRLVDESTLEVELITTNTGNTRLPYYAGHHFYFALPHGQRGEASVELPPTQLCAQLSDGSIGPREPGQASYRLDDATISDRFHCLDDGGAPGKPVRMIVPGYTVEFDLARPGSAPWYAVTTWTESEQSDFYCVEPWLGLPNAIHHGEGLRWLEPGQRETAALRMRVSLTG